MLISILILILVANLTYLLTDFRRYRQVEDLTLYYEHKLNNLTDRAFHAGLKIGSGSNDDVYDQEIDLRVYSN